MSTVPHRGRRRRSERSALQILEESFHLLRTVDPKAFWIFYLGAAPFAVAILYFVADMSRSTLATQNVASASLVMVAFYFWMRLCQARFCAELWETISPGQVPERSRWQQCRRVAAACCVQAFHPPLLLVGLVFAVPLGWIVATFQNAAVFAFTRGDGERPLRELVGSSLRRSHDEWAQNHGVLLILSVVALFTWINVVFTCIMVPSLGKSLFGVESVFTLSPLAAVLNTTFFLGSLLLTWLVVSPMVKAAYVLRCFYAESRHTGADLTSRLAACRAGRREVRARAPGRPVGTALLAGLALASGLLASARAAEDGPPERFRERIGETLEQKKYQWQLSRPEAVVEGEQEGWLARRIREIAEATRDAVRSVGEWMEGMMERLEEWLRPGMSPKPEVGRGWLEGVESTLSIAVILVLGALLIWLALMLYRRYRGREPAEGEGAGEVGPIDLQSEDIVASQLPEDEWMRLAREQMAKGDGRLAIRALFLATLANLGECELLRIARFKSNRDYRRELVRRARGRETLRDAFDENTELFERSWYGRHPAGDEVVERFLRNYERIAEASGTRPPPPSVSAAAG